MHPVLFRFGNLTIGTYGLMLVVGMLAGLTLASFVARRRGLRADFFWDLAFVLLVSGLLGARLLYLAVNWDDFLRAPAALLLARQGFVFQGGFLVALVAGIAFILWRRMPLFEVGDVLAPGLALAHGIGRIGCFLAGCCYGRVCTPGQASAWMQALAVRYPLILDAHGIPDGMFNFAFRDQLQAGLLDGGAPASLPLFPVQLFEAAGNFLICLLLLAAWRGKRFSGQIFGLYLVAYSLLRFGLEYLRGDRERGLWFDDLLSTAQLISIATLIAGLIFLLVRSFHGLETIPATARPPVGEPAAPPPAQSGPDAAAPVELPAAGPRRARRNRRHPRRAAP
ncbi:MAG TPA: prolipoprotein diacylglyceryl transferase [Candidatus Sumerlaeota bacterium]|nr:prolipoprotein diacylglyceryl transferase [Candidatus Sumerlaeota bacterium]